MPSSHALTVTEGWDGTPGGPWPSQWEISSGPNDVYISTTTGSTGAVRYDGSGTTAERTTTALIENTTATDVTQSVDLRMYRGSVNNVKAGLVARHDGTSDSYYLAEVAWYAAASGQAYLRIKKIENGSSSVLADVEIGNSNVSSSDYSLIEFEVEDVDGEAELVATYTSHAGPVFVLNASDSSPLPAGQFGVQAYMASSSARFAYFDNYEADTDSGSGPGPGPGGQVLVTEDWDGTPDDPWPGQWDLSAGPNDVYISSSGTTGTVRYAGSGTSAELTTTALINHATATDVAQSVSFRMWSSDVKNARAGIVARVNGASDSYYLAEVAWPAPASGEAYLRLHKVDGGSSSLVDSVQVGNSNVSGSNYGHLEFAVEDVDGSAEFSVTYTAHTGLIFTLDASDSNPLPGGRFGLQAKVGSNTSRFVDFDSYEALGDATGTVVAENGQAMMPVIVSANASSTSLTAADELAEYLEAITGDEFSVQVGDGTTGLAVGTAEEFPALNLESQFDPDDPFRLEEYILRSHADGVHLIGAKPGAARLAVWDLLYRLGHRQFYPTDHWEVIPSEPNITVAVDVVDKPDWYRRQIYPGGSHWGYAEPYWEKWRIRNRNDAGTDFDLRTSHIYGDIISSNQSEFDTHPEYYAEVDGVREYRGSNTKICIGNPNLRQLVVDYAVDKIQNNPSWNSISMDPSDGGNWCENADCAALGSVSDQVVTLANEVADAINNLGMGDKYVGIYAYAAYSPPPNIQVHPKIVVSVATAFLREGYSAKQLAELWSAKGAIIGIREYYSISTWHGDRPNEARASDIPYLIDTVTHFHENGALFNKANVSHSWGGYGFGFYLLAQMLWDVDATDRVEELFDDFVERGFGAASEPIEDFYRLIYKFESGQVMHPISEHLAGLMYRHLDDALALADPNDADLIARIHDLILYTRYVELYYKTDMASGSAKQDLGEELIRHIHAIRRSMLTVSYNADVRRLPSFDYPSGSELEAIKDVDEWTPAEIEQKLADGIVNNELLDFEPVHFSRDLVPAKDALNLPTVTPGNFGTHAPRWNQQFYTWVEQPGDIDLTVQGGLISHYQDRGNVKITLYASQDEIGDGVDFDDSVPPDGTEYPVTLQTPYTGLHWIYASDGGDSTYVHLDDSSMPYTVSVEGSQRFSYRGKWNLYFYVPKGTEVIGGFTENVSGWVLDGDGNEVYDFSDDGDVGHFSFPVPQGQDGKLWKMEDCEGPRRLLTVPPYFAASADKLLLPEEVVNADAD